MPAHDRFRRHDARELIQDAAAKGYAATGWTDSVGVGQVEPVSAKLSLQDPVLFLKVLEHALLLAVEPAGEDDREDLEDGGHGAGDGGDLTEPPNQII